MSRSSPAQLLAELCRELDPPPARVPYYVRDRPWSLRDQFPADGWYWVPAGHHVAVYLAKNEREAREVLLEQLRRQLEALV